MSSGMMASGGIAMGAPVTNKGCLKERLFKNRVTTNSCETHFIESEGDVEKGLCRLDPLSPCADT